MIVKNDVIDFLQSLEKFADGEMDLQDLKTCNEGRLAEYRVAIPRADVEEYLIGIGQMLDNEEVDTASEEFLRNAK